MKRESQNLLESFNSNLKEDEFYGGGANEKVGGDYNDFIYELSNFRATMNNWYDQCSTHLAQQIVEETIMCFDNLLKNYEHQKDIEIISALDESEKLEESTGLYDKVYQINDIDELKEIALNAIYVANNDKDIIDALLDHTDKDWQEEYAYEISEFSTAPYSFIANNYNNLTTDFLREIALNAVYVANNDEAIEKEIEERK